MRKFGYFTAHSRLQEIVNTYRMVNPTIVLKRRKSGSFYYEMNIPYEVQSKKLKKKKRVLGIDLGIKKFAVLTIVEDYLPAQAGKHSCPVFIKNEVLGYLKRLRGHQARIQESLSRIKKTGDNKEFKHLHAHYRRVQRKFRAVNIQIAHEVSKFIVLYAEANNCDIIAFERLGSSSKGKHSKDLNWLISNWIRSKIIDYTKYKAKLKGIRIWLVNPRYTSRVCSKCGAHSKTYKDSYLREEITTLLSISQDYALKELKI